MKNKTILLVEDDFLNRRFTKKTLLNAGYDIFEAKNFKESAEVLKKENIDMIILDIHLGENEINGISLAQYIQENYSIPFIFLTSYEDSEIISQAVATLPFSYLTKPFKTIDLITSVEIALKHKDNLPNKKSTIVVKDEDYHVEIQLDEINYVESQGNYLFFHTNIKVYKLRSTMKQMLDILPPKVFIQVHRAFIVNKLKIEKYSNNSLVINGVNISISKVYIEDTSILKM